MESIVENHPLYSLILKTEQTRDPVTMAWDVIQTLSAFGDALAPSYIGTGSGQREPLALADQRDLVKLLDEQRDHFGGAGELGIPLALTPTDPLVRVYLTIGQIGGPSSLVVDFSAEVAIDRLISTAHLRRLFSLLVSNTVPAWGCIQEADNTDRLGQRYQAAVGRRRASIWAEPSKRPMVHWYNYLGPGLTRQLGGIERVLACPAWRTEQIAELGGVVIILQEEPFDNSNREHLARQNQAMEFLGFSAAYGGKWPPP